MKRLLYVLTTFFILGFQILPATAVAPICKEGTINIASGDNAVAFGGSFGHVIIKTSTSAAIVYISPNNTVASTADFQIDPGGSLQYGLAGQMSAGPGFHYFGASAVGTLSWMAY